MYLIVRELTDLFYIKKTSTTILFYCFSKGDLVIDPETKEFLVDVTDEKQLIWQKIPEK